MKETETESTLVTYSNAPENCQMCHGPFKGVMYDAKTYMGPWGNLCTNCYAEYGVGLGLGRGQKYVLQVVKFVSDAGSGRMRWVKTQG